MGIVYFDCHVCMTTTKLQIFSSSPLRIQCNYLAIAELVSGYIYFSSLARYNCNVHPNLPSSKPCPSLIHFACIGGTIPTQAKLTKLDLHKTTTKIWSLVDKSQLIKAIYLLSLLLMPSVRCLSVVKQTHLIG